MNAPAPLIPTASASHAASAACSHFLDRDRAPHATRAADTTSAHETAYQTLKERCVLAQTTTAALARVKPEWILMSDGSNFRKWYQEVAFVLEEFCDDRSFFERREVDMDSPLERLGWSILTNSISPNLRTQITHLRPTTKAFIWLQDRCLLDRFTIGSRTAQLAAWRALIGLDASKFDSVAGLLSHLQLLVNDLKDQQLRLEDHVIGLILQNSLSSKPALAAEVMMRLDLLIFSTQRIPSSTEIGRIIDICDRQLKDKNKLTLERESRSILANSSSLSERPAARDSQDQKHDTSSRPTNVPFGGLHWHQAEELKTPSQSEAFVMSVERRCWRCRSPGHLLANCPIRANPGSVPQALPDQRRTTGPGFVAHYPR